MMGTMLYTLAVESECWEGREGGDKGRGGGRGGGMLEGKAEDEGREEEGSIVRERRERR